MVDDMGSSCKKRRLYDSLPVVICEWHQHVLPHIHRAIASRHLSTSCLTMYHFDAHPDLTIPLTMYADDCFDKEVLYDQLEIADWILPLAYEGHLRQVVWLKAHWANQIDDGEFDVKVGKDFETDCLRINCKDDYFLEELLYSKENNLIDAKDLNIKIVTMDDKVVEQCNCSEITSFDQHKESNELNGATHTTPVKKCEHCGLNKCNNHLEQNTFAAKIILDIDLDFFSTYNPFKLRNSKEDFEKLKEIYEFQPPESLSDEHITISTELRKVQLEKLQRTIKYFMQIKNIDQNEHNWDFLDLISDEDRMLTETEIDENYLCLLKDIWKRHKMDKKEIDLELIHFAGMSSDLPHHKSTVTEINELLKSVENYLTAIPKPTFVTISRSTLDEYTPSDQVEYIQEKVIGLLERLYKEINILKDYDTSN